MRKNHIIKIYSKRDFTDSNYLKIRSEDISPNDFSEKICAHSFESEYSKDILNAILEFNSGAFFPDRVDVYEPIKEKYSLKINSKIIDWISQAGGNLFLKRIKKEKYLAQLENLRISKIWNEKGRSNLEFNDPEILSAITFYFSININTEIDLKYQLIDKLVDISKAELAYSYIGENFDGNNMYKLSKDAISKNIEKHGCSVIKIW